MEKHIFLTGPSGCGKSALIRSVLGARLAEAGGFVTERILSPDGRFLGCALSPAAVAGGVEGFAALHFLDCSVFPPKADKEAFRVNAVQLLREAPYYSFSLFDALGGFELVIPQFREALADYLSAGQPCVGALMAEDSVHALRLSLGLGERGEEYSLRLQSALAAAPDTRLLRMGEGQDEAVREVLVQWAAEYVGGTP